MGIEPTYEAWKASALPLSYTRKNWSERRDSNSRPLGPKPSALPLRHAPLRTLKHSAWRAWIATPANKARMSLRRPTWLNRRAAKGPSCARRVRRRLRAPEVLCRRIRGAGRASRHAYCLRARQARRPRPAVRAQPTTASSRASATPCPRPQGATQSEMSSTSPPVPMPLTMPAAASRSRQRCSRSPSPCQSASFEPKA